MAKLVLEVVGGDGDKYIISGDTQPNLQRLSTLFRDLAGGNKTTTYTVDCRVDCTTATGTVTCAAPQANDTVTINGTNLTATQKNATGTVTFSSLVNNDTVTVNGQLFTAKTTVTDSTTQFALGADDTEAAANLVTLVNASALSLVFRQFTATSSAGVVTFRAYTAGTAGNSITLASSDDTKAHVSGATLENGAAPANNAFDFTGSTTEQAASLAACINASTTAIIGKIVEATSSGAVVTISAQISGYAGNAVTLASSNSGRLAVSGSRLTGGLGTTVTMNF